MGEVYRARDTRLDRIVAIKVLSSRLASDAEGRQRFEREARTISQLSHPNICTLYDVGEADVPAAEPARGEVRASYLVMEHLSGETLAARLRNGALPLVQALDIAVQIADGLAAAHRHGIIHRDLKPANIMVTPDGQAKVLDFGLAKLVERGADVEGTATLTMEQRLVTEAGQRLGTIAYMSPEQVTGDPLDERSDIFSFGIVLYEMVTGRRPFDGESNASTVRAILASDPAPPGNLTGRLRPELELAILRCLRKDPHRRWQSMADLKVTLEELEADLKSGRGSQRTAAAVWRLRPAWALPAAAALALVVAVGAAGWLLRAPSPASTLEVERLTFEGSAIVPPAVSADGKLLAYVSKRDGWFNLFVQQVGARQAVRLTSHETNDSYPAFSPDGLRLVYRSERGGGGLYSIDTLGGADRAERQVADRGQCPSFSPDGTTIAYVVPDPLESTAGVFLVSAGGGTPRQLGSDVVAYRPGGVFGAPLWSPDGGSLLFIGMRRARLATRGWWIAPIGGGEPAVLEGAPSLQRWAGMGLVAWRGDFIYYLEGEPTSGTTLYRVRVAPGPWTVRGQPEKLASLAGFAFGHSVSSDGRIALTSIQPTTNIWSAALGPDGTAGALERLTEDSTGKRNLSGAADGSRLAYVTYDTSTRRNVEIRVRDLRTGQESLLAGTGHWPFLDPFLSRDGSRMAWTDVPETRSVGYVADDLSAGRPFCEDCLVMGLFDHPPAGLVTSGDGLARQPFDGGTATMLVEDPALSAASVAPDGRWLALIRRQDGRARLYLADVQRGAPRPEGWTLVADDPSYLGSPTWSPDGTVLYYLSPRDGFRCVWAQRITREGSPLEAVPVLHLHGLHPALDFGGGHRIAVTKDRVFVLVTDVSGDVWSVKLDR